MYRSYRYRSAAWDTFWSVLKGLGVIVLILAVIAVAVLIGGYLANQGGTNFAGAGNRYEIEATVTGTTDHSVFVTDVRVISAEGKARQWFGSAGNLWSANHFELQDHFKDGDGLYHLVGTVSYSGNPDFDAYIEDLSPGTRVRVWGTIGDTQQDKSTRTEARFKTVVMLPEP